MEGGGTEGAGGQPRSGRDTVRAGGASLSTLEEFNNVYLSGELLFFQNHGDDVVIGELGGLGEVNTFWGEDFGPAGGEGVSGLIRV